MPGGSTTKQRNVVMMMVEYLVPPVQQSIPKIKLLRNSKTRLNMECSSPVRNNHLPARILDNRDRIEALSLVYAFYL